MECNPLVLFFFSVCVGVCVCFCVCLCACVCLACLCALAWKCMCNLTLPSVSEELHSQSECREMEGTWQLFYHGRPKLFLLFKAGIGNMQYKY